MRQFNNLESTIDKFKKSGIKVEPVPLDKIIAISKHMEEVRRDFIIKSVQSEREAAKIIFTA